MNDIISSIDSVITTIMGWPIIFFVIGVGIIVTIALRFVQLRYFVAAWKYTFAPSSSARKSDMSPMQAFINTLNVTIGNGSLAGMATAIYSGGPGAALWVIIITLLLMSVRFSEVFLSTHYALHAPKDTKIGGPMLYLRTLKGGVYFAYAYAFACFIFGLIAAVSMQSNSISLSMFTTWKISFMITAVILSAFIFYAIVGGAERIIKFSQMIVPLKVGLFFGSAIIILFYHYQQIIPSLKLIINSGLNLRAFAGGLAGFSIQQAMKYGILRSINATESGLGTAAILFGSTGSVHPVRDGIMSMATSLISSLVCFTISLCIVASGVWNSGATSTALTIAAYQSVFGSIGGWMVTFLSTTFGIGVMVSYAYITKAAWDAITRNRFSYLFIFIYCACAFFGAWTEKVTSLWALVDISLACMLIINLIGIVCLLPVIKKGLRSFQNEKE
jgi:alanine or glycine:cation symporter, AGCS family